MDDIAAGGIVIGIVEAGSIAAGGVAGRVAAVGFASAADCARRRHGKWHRNGQRHACNAAAAGITASSGVMSGIATEGVTTAWLVPSLTARSPTPCDPSSPASSPSFCLAARLAALLLIGGADAEDVAASRQTVSRWAAARRMALRRLAS